LTSMAGSQIEASIRISAEVYDALSNVADEFGGRMQEAELLGDGWYELPVTEDVLLRLNRIDHDPDQAARLLLGWGRLPS
jgi:hypothetical protein